MIETTAWPAMTIAIVVALFIRIITMSLGIDARASMRIAMCLGMRNALRRVLTREIDAPMTYFSRKMKPREK